MTDKEISGDLRPGQSFTVRGETRVVISVRDQLFAGVQQPVIKYFASIGDLHLNGAQTCTLEEWKSWANGPGKKEI